MLAVHPSAGRPPSIPANFMQRRGRSRQISHAALARQASEERASTSICSVDIQRRLFVRATIKVMSPEKTPSTLSPGSQSDSLQPEPELTQEPVAPASPSPAMATIPIAAPVPHKVSSTPPFLRSPTPSPPPSASLSPDYYDSPPSPPRSLEDQVHVAYALDDIHLAKVLLLKLKGIEVTSDDDPRIAAVQDEDFDMYFVPSGRLLDEADEKAVLEVQRKELERLEEKRRVERLRACERIWEQEKRRLREERLVAVRRREIEEGKKRVAKEREAIAEAERADARAVRLRRLRVGNELRNVVSYSSLDQQRGPPSVGSSSSGTLQTDDQPFVYTFMIPTSKSTTPPRRTLALPNTTAKSSSRRALSPIPTQYDETRAVPFKDVLTSMQGPLFPLPLAEQRRSSSLGKSQSTGRRREEELLECLLKVVEWEEGERRRRKGKGRVMVERRDSWRSVSSTTSDCAACSAASTSVSAPSASPVSTASSDSSNGRSRAGSWFSFASSSSSGTDSISSSASTALTTLSMSGSPLSIPRWFKHSSPFSSSRTQLSLVTSQPLAHSPSPSPVSLIQPPPLRHSCRSHSHLVVVLPEESPLPLSLDRAPSRRNNDEEQWAAQHGSILSLKETEAQARMGGRTQSRHVTTTEMMVRKVTKFVELAKGFQNAYMNAALFSVVASSDEWEHRDAHEFSRESCSGKKMSSWSGDREHELRPAGYRVRPGDVAVFTAASVHIPHLDVTVPAAATLSAALSTESGPSQAIISTSPSLAAPTAVAATYIPLMSPFPPTHPPRTTLPNPLPYPIVFKPQPPVTRLPLRRFGQFQMVSSSLGASPSPPPPLSSQFRHSTPYTELIVDETGTKPRSILWRQRAVANPVYLRLKAVQNIVWERGVNWEGRARDGGLGTGREKVIGLAYEGVGRSWLGATWVVAT